MAFESEICFGGPIKLFLLIVGLYAYLDLEKTIKREKQKKILTLGNILNYNFNFVLDQ